MAPAKQTKSKKYLERTRKIIAAWPETDERLSHGAPTWWGGKKTFANFSDNHHGDGRVALWIKSDFDTQEGRIDWKMIEGLLEAGYRAVAPKRAIKQLEMRES